MITSLLIIPKILFLIDAFDISAGQTSWNKGILKLKFRSKAWYPLWAWPKLTRCVWLPMVVPKLSNNTSLSWLKWKKEKCKVQFFWSIDHFLFLLRRFSDGLLLPLLGSCYNWHEAHVIEVFFFFSLLLLLSIFLLFRNKVVSAWIYWEAAWNAHKNRGVLSLFLDFYYSWRPILTYP